MPEPQLEATAQPTVSVFQPVLGVAHCRMVAERIEEEKVKGGRFHPIDVGRVADDCVGTGVGEKAIEF